MTMNAPVLIPASQARVHVATEALSLVTVLPFMIYLAATKRPTWQRWVAGAIAVGTIWIDGGLLRTWSRSTVRP